MYNESHVSIPQYYVYLKYDVISSDDGSVLGSISDSYFRETYREASALQKKFSKRIGKIKKNCYLCHHLLLTDVYIETKYFTI